jgi:hypothetical protein
MPAKQEILVLPPFNLIFQYQGPLSSLWGWFRRSAIETKDAVSMGILSTRGCTYIPSLVSSSSYLVHITLLWQLANCAQKH